MKRERERLLKWIDVYFFNQSDCWSSFLLNVFKRNIRPDYNPFFSSLSINFHEKNKKDDITLLEYMFIEWATYTCFKKDIVYKSKYIQIYMFPSSPFFRLSIFLWYIASGQINLCCNMFSLYLTNPTILIMSSTPHTMYFFWGESSEKRVTLGTPYSSKILLSTTEIKARNLEELWYEWIKYVITSPTYQDARFLLISRMLSMIR